MVPLQADVHLRAHLEHVTAVQRAVGDHGGLQPQLVDRSLYRNDFRVAGRLTRIRDDREVAEHDDGVLDEDAVGHRVVGIDDHGRPPAAVQRRDVAVPLSVGQREIHWLTVDERHDAIGQAVRRPPHQCVRTIRHQTS